MTHNPQTGKERQTGSVGYEECIGTWDAGSSPSAATIASLCLCCLVYQLFSGLASSPWITCYLSSLVRRGLLGSFSDDVSNPRSNYLILIARQCLVVLPALFNMISGVHLPLPPVVTSLDTPGYTLFLLVVRSYKPFATMVHTQFSTPIRVFYDDYGGILF